MKITRLLIFLLVIGWNAQAAPLDDKIKAFSDALKAAQTEKSSADPMMNARLAAMASTFDLSPPPPGGEANFEASIRQMMATISNPSVQAAGQALIDELEANRKTRLADLNAKVDAVLARIPPLLESAKTTKDLDDILADLQKVSPPAGLYGYDQETQAVTARVNNAYQFVTQWQDYLSYHAAGNTQEALNTLRNLSNNRQMGDTVLIPRSEILAAITALGGTPQPSSPGYTSPPDLTPTIEGIKTLDDIAPALAAIIKLTHMQFGNEYNELAHMALLYADAKNGLPVTLDIVSTNGYVNPGQPAMERVKSMLLLYLLPRFIGPAAPAPNPDETVQAYLDRSLTTAAAAQDLPAIERVVEAKMQISKPQMMQPGSQSFLGGLNQEMAGQYDLALSSYESALKNADDFTPVKIIGDRLAAIKKDHPTEYEEGMKSFSNPPTPTFANPYGMRGQPYPYRYPGAAPARTQPLLNPSPAATNPAPVTPSR